MAARKKRTLTLEEQLEAVLVPEDEWPYEVPNNWCWIRLLDSFVNKTDSKKKIAQKLYKNYGDIAIVDQGEKLIGGYTDDSELQYAGRLPVIIFGDHTRRLKYVDFPFAQGADGVKVLLPKPFIDPKFFFYALQNVDIPNLGYRRHFPLFKNFCIPLPSMHEQRLIVQRVEHFYSKLDDAEAELRKVIDSSEQRQTAVLHRAFSGQLTETWRKEHDISQETWTKKTLGEVCTSIFDGDHMPPPKASKGIPFLVISNVNNGHLSFEDTRFVPEDYYNNLTVTRKPEIGDILYTLVGSYGIPVMVDDERPFCFQRHVALLKPRDIEQKFLWYLLRSPIMFEKATAIATGTAQLTVPIKGLRNLAFDCPGNEERAEIIRQLDVLLSKEEQMLAAVRNVLEVTALTRQSILAKAFRGELGTNNPGELSSKALLANILSGNAGK